jgi:hypothetical protein
MKRFLRSIQGNDLSICHFLIFCKHFLGSVDKSPEYLLIKERKGEGAFYDGGGKLDRSMR